MTNLYILNEQGSPEPTDDLLVFSRWFQEDERRIVRKQRWQRENGDDVLVSTVFLGMNHAWMSGPPVLWETMAFVNGEGLEQDRYTSREDAIEGHQRMVRAMGGPELD